MMTAGYTKLFSEILTSTIWLEPDATRIVWITLLALADKNGEVQASVPGLAKIAGVTLDETLTALDTFKSPDPHSRTKDFEGRRIEEIPGGWLLLNHAAYRERMSKEDRREKDRVRKARKRAEDSENVRSCPQLSAVVRSCPEMSAMSAHTEAEAEAKSETKKSGDSPPPSSDSGENPEKEEKEKASPISPEKLILEGAKRLGVPEDFAQALAVDVGARGGKDSNGNPIVSPVLYLQARWNDEKKRRNRTDGNAGAFESPESVGTAEKGFGPSEASREQKQAWQIEKDEKRIKEEIKRIEADPSSRNLNNGHTLTREKHEEIYRAAWLERVAKCHEEAKSKLKSDFAKFQESFSAEVAQLTADAAKVNVAPPDPEAFAEIELVRFQEFFSEDVPDFWKWDQTFNKANAWVDPRGFLPEAASRLRMLRERLRALENERRALF